MPVRNTAQILKATADENLRRVGTSLVELEDRLDSIVDGTTTIISTSTAGGAASGTPLTVRLVTASTTAAATDDIILCDTSSGNLVVTLPLAATTRTRPLTIIKYTIDANTVTVTPAGADSGSLVLQYQWQVWNRMNYLTDWVKVDELPASVLGASDESLKAVSIVDVTTSLLNGRLAVHVNYMPPRLGIAVLVIGSFKGVNVHTQDATDKGTWQGKFPYTGTFLAGDSTEYGTADFSLPVPASFPHDVWIHIPSYGESREIAYQKGVISGGTLSGVPYPTHKLTITSGMATQPTSGFSVAVEERATDLGTEQRFKFMFTPPAGDPGYGHTLIQDAACDSSFVKITQFDDDARPYRPVTSPGYSDWKMAPEATEYHKFKATTVSRDGVRDTASAPTYDLTVPGTPKLIDFGKADPLTYAGALFINPATGKFEIKLDGNTMIVDPVTGGLASPAQNILSELGIDTTTLTKDGSKLTLVSADLLLANYLVAAFARLTVGMQIKSTVTGSPEVNIGAGAVEVKCGGNIVAVTPTVVSLQQGSQTITLNASAGVTVTGSGNVTVNGSAGRVVLSSSQTKLEFGSSYMQIDSVGIYLNTTINVQDRFIVTATKVEANQPFYATSGWGNAARERMSLLPSATGNQGKFLRVNAGATDVEWGDTGASVSWGSVSDKPSTFPPESHAYSSHTGLPTLGNSASRNVGTGSGDVAYGDHTHGGYTGSLLVNNDLHRLNFTAGVLMSIDWLG
jgi:hypothetical protein